MSFPAARIKKIIKQDPAAPNAIAAYSITLITIATEKFVQLLASDALEYAKQDKRKGIAYADLNKSVRGKDSFDFLEDVIPPPIALRKAAEIQSKMDMEDDDE